MAKMCIDQGHAGLYNRSPVMPAYYESVMNWQLGILLKTELEKRGHEVIMTRKELSVDLSLDARGRASEGCDLFLSLHSNACGTESVDYPVAFALIDDVTTQIDDISKKIATKLTAVVAKTMGTTGAGKVSTKQSEYDRNGDGLMNDNYYGVLHAARQVGTPAVLMEHSFHTNKRAARWLLELANLEKLAIAEAEALNAYFNGTATAAPTAKQLYRVQVGAFKEKTYAEEQLEKVKAAGFDAFIAYDREYYRVQVGAFSRQDYATALLQKVTRAGFQAFVTQGPKPIISAQKSLDTIAKEVLAGKWGNNPERRQKLAAAGYDADAVQLRVNAMLG